MTLVTDQSTTNKGVKINLHSSSLIKTSNKHQPSSGLSSSLLMKTSCLRLKLVELNFFASFNANCLGPIAWPSLTHAQCTSEAHARPRPLYIRRSPSTSTALAHQHYNLYSTSTAINGLPSRQATTR